MTILACMCNQPQRLAEALTPLRASLVTPQPVSRWGLGYVQGGEILLSRTPRRTAEPLDFFPAIAALTSDCLIGHAAHDAVELGTDGTQPVRFRRWMLAQDGLALIDDEPWREIAQRIPEFLRRNLRGRTTAELTLHVTLALLHDQGLLDEPNLPGPIWRRTLAEALALVANGLVRKGVHTDLGNLATSNSRSLAVVRLAGPVYVRRLHVNNERGQRDEGFRGVLVVAADKPPGDGAEEVPVGSVVMVSRDLRVDLTPLA
ncbi:MAG TPA: hypothetical protein VHE35_02505 [Kofleriaceae bacterium]|nr:hypothetical protein [Kofleriaceae bacterium]